jgi:cytochrome o ubiquinol oxidase subunit II
MTTYDSCSRRRATAQRCCGDLAPEPTSTSPRTAVSSAWRRRSAFGLWVVLVWLSGCTKAPTPPAFATSHPGPALTFLVPHGAIAAAQRYHFLEVVAMVLIVVAPVLLVAPFFAWRYRYGGSARYTPKWSFYWPLEIAIWGIPVAIVVVLAVWLWENTHALDPYAPIASNQPPVRIEVVGYDWKWLFIYPDLGIASMGEMAFPAGRPLALELTSDTVVQSFLIPALGSQIYAMPGRITRLHLEASGPGRFQGENAHFNGDGYFQQHFLARALTPTGFDEWVKLVRSKGIPLSAQAYQAIAGRTTLVDTRKALGVASGSDGAVYFKSIPPTLFGRIVASFHTNTPANPAAE